MSPWLVSHFEAFLSLRDIGSFAPGALIRINTQQKDNLSEVHRSFAAPIRWVEYGVSRQ